MSSPNSDDFRRAMSLYPAAVTVVAAVGADGPAGATANSVTSLSIDPPMMLACLDKGSRTLGSVRAAGTFSINMLSRDQAELAKRFSGKGPIAEKWDGVRWAEQAGTPRLAGAIIWIRCVLNDLIDGGDHSIVTGRVTALEVADGEPLISYGAGYRGLGSEG